MFYEAATNAHGLPHDPFKALVAPRPIGWISTRTRDGQINLAPYSFFNALCDRPKLVMFSSTPRAKDSAVFAQDSGEFVANLVSEHVATRMNQTSVDAPRGVSEFEVAGLTHGRMPVCCSAACRRSLRCARVQTYAGDRAAYDRRWQC